MLDPRVVDPMPWRNGLGSTRELAVASDAGGTTTWRVSLADLDRDAAFSSFPAMDRVFLALGALHLTIDGVVARLDAGDQIAFAGEAEVSVSVEQPASALNVMTRRDVCRADVVLRSPGDRPAGDVTVSVGLDTMIADVRIHDGRDTP